jgi:hypothetical protein
MTASASRSVSPGPNECGDTPRGPWRPERPFPSSWARCGRAPECDTEPLFNPVHPGHPVLQLQLQLLPEKPPRQ